MRSNKLHPLYGQWLDRHAELYKQWCKSQKIVPVQIREKADARPMLEPNTGPIRSHFDAFAMLRTLPTGSHSACITSPPYFGGVHCISAKN